MSYTINVENGKRFDQYPLLQQVANGNDVIMAYMADGTGVKTLALAVLKSWITGDLDNAFGDLSDLSTNKKNTIVAAINEVVAKATMDRESFDALVKTVEDINELTALLKRTGASRANSLITEYSLGTAFTLEMSNDIRNGTFEKVRTGGYITLNGRKYWAGDANYRKNCGDTALATNHMLFFPDVSLFDMAWNQTNDTTGGYVNSKVKKEGMAKALEIIKADFGADHILNHRILLTNAVANGVSSGWAWFDSQVDLMNEKMVYGSNAWGGGSQNGYDTGADKSQIALFKARHDLITNRQTWWLRDVRSAAGACGVGGVGDANCWGASGVFGVRPAFLVY